MLCVRACVHVRNRNGDHDVCLFVCLYVGRGGLNWSADDGHGYATGEMLAPALLLAGSAVPIVTIRTVLWCARGDGFLCVGAEELSGVEMS
jgi:hypothetical protein